MVLKQSFRKGKSVRLIPTLPPTEQLHREKAVTQLKAEFCNEFGEGQNWSYKKLVKPCEA